MRRKQGSKGYIFIFFGIGLFIAYCFPSNVLIIALALILVGAGVILLKS